MKKVLLLCALMCTAGQMYGNLNQKLMHAFEENDTFDARMAIKQGAQISHNPDDFYTAENFMSVAIANPNLELVKIVLANGPKDRSIYKAHLEALKRQMESDNPVYREFAPKAYALISND